MLYYIENKVESFWNLVLDTKKRLLISEKMLTNPSAECKR